MPTGIYKRQPLEERFWSKVNKTSSCWLWIASQNGVGYGRFAINRKLKLAHRVAYEMLISKIPKGLVLDHLCRVRHCVNPDHLEPVTHGVNISRGVFSKRTSCKNGHEYTEENTYYHPSTNFRECRKCMRAWAKNYRLTRQKAIAI